MILNDVRRVVREWWHDKKIEPEHVEIAWQNEQRKSVTGEEDFIG